MNETNNLISFSESGGPEIIAEVEIGTYSALERSNAILAALNIAGTHTYSCVFDRTTNLVTITASGSFQLLGATGTTTSVSLLPHIGFLTDTALGNTATGTQEACLKWSPQFPAQNYVPVTNNARAVEAAVNKSASGEVQVVSFGIEKFTKMSFRYITNEKIESDFIKSDSEAVNNANAFMLYAIQKKKIEFLYDIENKSDFLVLLLESTPQDQKGTGYELTEMLGQGLVGYFETGLLNFRQVIS